MTEADEQRQLSLEAESVALGKDRYWKKVEKRGLADSAPGMRLTRAAIEPLAKAIREFTESATTARACRRHTAEPYLAQVEPEAAAWLAAHAAFDAVSRRIPMMALAIGLADRLREHIEWTELAKQQPGLARVVGAKLAKSTSVRHRRAVSNHVIKTKGAKLVWPAEVKSKVGALLIELLITSTGLFQAVTETKRARKRTYLVLTPDTQKAVDEMHGRCSLLSPVHLPMVVPPKPWTGVFNGGYLRRRLPLVKTDNHNFLEELRHVEMPAVYDAVNALQATAWRINPGVLAVMKQAWEGGGGLGELPPRENLPLPAKPVDIATNDEARKKWRRKAAEVYEENARLVSKRLSVIRKLQIAERFKAEPALYFPHVLDWRGRVYPVSSDVTPQADDAGRALLTFAEGKPLGETGAWWLAVHIANCFGVDKVSFGERVAWVEQNSDKLLDSAMFPLDGMRFWCTADKPWQALAACFEWAGFAMQGKEYVSRLPVAVDGSCNGLQNFSAMMLDEVGGAATNLVPSDTPQDIYQRVADEVKLRVYADMQGGDNVTMAKVWLGKIDRALVKRPVMTLPYGATRYGMRDQLFAEAKKLGLDLGPEPFDACIYLSNVVYHAIGTVVVAARQAMDWLQEAARVVAKNGLPVRWTAPQGFVVLQDYRVQRGRQVRVTLGGRPALLTLNVDTDRVDSRRQALGISPNFVHSCDAAHLMHTVVLCVGEGIKSFGMIHDSYATVAADAEALSRLLRQAFVEQYSGDVLGKFRAELIEQLPPELVEELPEMPERGALDISCVLGSDYFFA